MLNCLRRLPDNFCSYPLARFIVQCRYVAPLSMSQAAQSCVRSSSICVSRFAWASDWAYKFLDQLCRRHHGSFAMIVRNSLLGVDAHDGETSSKPNHV